MSEAESEDKRLITGQERHPCGCQETTYSDGITVIMPCQACGLMDAAKSLQRASQALAAVAMRIRQDSPGVVMDSSIRKVLQT